MALLRDIISNNQFILQPLYYERKEEHWLTAKNSLTQNDQEIAKGDIPLHISDFQSLIYGIRQIVDNNNKNYILDPIEPHLKILIERNNGAILWDISFSNGPLFHESQYVHLKIQTLDVAALKFAEELTSEIKKINPGLDLGRLYQL